MYEIKYFNDFSSTLANKNTIKENSFYRRPVKLITIFMKPTRAAEKMEEED